MPELQQSLCNIATAQLALQPGWYYANINTLASQVTLSFSLAMAYLACLLEFHGGVYMYKS